MDVEQEEEILVLLENDTFLFDENSLDLIYNNEVDMFYNGKIIHRDGHNGGTELFALARDFFDDAMSSISNCFYTNKRLYQDIEYNIHWTESHLDSYWEQEMNALKDEFRDTHIQNLKKIEKIILLNNDNDIAIVETKLDVMQYAIELFSNAMIKQFEVHQQTLFIRSMKNYYEEFHEDVDENIESDIEIEDVAFEGNSKLRISRKAII